jgi:hypothetical protein
MEFTWMGKTFAAPRWEWIGGRVVWGATGRVLHNLRSRLRAT